MTRLVVVEGYTYERYLGYTYAKKRNGRRYRVHHFKTIAVPGYSYTIRVAAPKRKRKPTPAVLAPKARKAPAPKAKPKKKRTPQAAPKPKKKRKPKPKPVAAPAPFTPSPKPQGWIKAAEWQDYLEAHLEKQVELEGEHEFKISWDGPIVKKNAASDMISRDLFVWPTDRYPRGLTLKKYPMLGTNIFYMARLWVLIEHLQTGEFLVWVKTARLPRVMNFDAAKEIVETKFFEAVRKTVEAFDYLACRQLIGWTLYTTGTKATHKRKKEGTE